MSYCVFGEIFEGLFTGKLNPNSTNILYPVRASRGDVEGKSPMPYNAKPHIARLTQSKIQELS